LGWFVGKLLAFANTPTMAQDWSREEVEAAVADYFDMLRAERSGIAYNKTEHRRALSKLLSKRTNGSIERKHQNISAALIELGMPYIEGYKPLGNYQRLLFDVVASQISSAADLHTVLKAEAARPAALPTMDDILASLVDAPAAAKRRPGAYRKGVSETPRIVRVVDYPAMEAANRSLGGAGEDFAVRFEQARLLAAGKDRLAGAVERVSVSKGDGLGYDVLSFDANGRERFIEVKTTAYGPATPFFVTRNEVSVSQSLPTQYHLYRLFDFRRQPRMFQKTGQIEQTFSLDAVQFLARLKDW
jgi:hypothetical protein